MFTSFEEFIDFWMIFYYMDSPQNGLHFLSFVFKKTTVVCGKSKKQLIIFRLQIVPKKITNTASRSCFSHVKTFFKCSGSYVMNREVYLSAPSSGYGHLNYGHHDGYSDHHGYTDHHVTYGSYSGYDCCPLVVDSLSLIALIGFIALATYFFRIQIIKTYHIKDL